MLKSKIGSVQEVILPDFPDDDNTVTTTVTKSRRVSFGTNFVKEFIVGSAVSAQYTSEYEQASQSSDSSGSNSSHSVADSGNLDRSSFIVPDGLRVHKSFSAGQSSESDSMDSRPKAQKYSSTICFSADSPTADMEFTEGCLTLAKSILDKKNKDMTVIIQAKPKETKDEEKGKGEETKYYPENDDDVSQFEMSMTRCLKPAEVNAREGKKFESEKTKIFSKFDDEMSITRCNKVFVDDRSERRWEESKENRMPLDMIIRHLDKDSSDLENDLFNSEKSFSSMLNESSLEFSNDSEELIFNEPMDMSIDLQPNLPKGSENAASLAKSPAALPVASPPALPAKSLVASPVAPPAALPTDFVSSPVAPPAASPVASPPASPPALLAKSLAASPVAPPVLPADPTVSPVASPAALSAKSVVPPITPPAALPEMSLDASPVRPSSALPDMSLVASPVAPAAALPDTSLDVSPPKSATASPVAISIMPLAASPAKSPAKSPVVMSAPLPLASPVALPTTLPASPIASPVASPSSIPSALPAKPLVSSPVAPPGTLPTPPPDMELCESVTCDSEPSLIDTKVIENLREQSKEPGCVWSLEHFQYPQNNVEGLLSFNCELLESSTRIHFQLKKSKEDSLYSCSIVASSEISLNKEKKWRLPEYQCVVEFGFQQLQKYHMELKQKVETIRHIPYFLDQVNSFMLKMNSLLRQIHSVLALYPGSTLKGSLLSFRLFSFPIFFSCNVSVDLTSLFKLSKSSLLFTHDFGSLDENKIREIFQDCRKCENSLCEFIVRSTKYLIDLEKESGYVSKRGHIGLLPSEYKL